jgi:hypothetical protein
MYGDYVETVVISDLYNVSVAHSYLVTVYMIDLWLKEMFLCC